AQEAGQPEQTAGFIQRLRALVAERAIGGEKLRAGLAGIEIFLRRRRPQEANSQNRRRQRNTTITKTNHCSQPFNSLPTRRPPFRRRGAVLIAHFRGIVTLPETVSLPIIC